MQFPWMLLLAATAPLAGGGAEPAIEPRDEEGAWSVALHLHGSFSHGRGTMGSHLWQADELGVDALWWSDSDFRIASYRSASTFSFDAEKEPIDRGEPWTARGPLEPSWTKHLRGRRSAKRRPRPGEAPGDFTNRNSRDGSPNFRIDIAAEGAMDFVRASRRLLADQGLFHRPLAAGITVRLQVFPLDHDYDGRAFIEFQLSEQPPRRGTPARSQTVHYYLSNLDSEPRLDLGRLQIPVPFRPGEWNELVLELTADAAAGFPHTPAWDNALGTIELGVEARAQASPEAHFDDLRIEQIASGAATFARQRELMELLAERWEGVAQYQGLEIAYAGPHLSELSSRPELLDYDRLAEEVTGSEEEGAFSEPAFVRRVLERAVAGAHARGGLVSYNHPFGTALGQDAVGPPLEEVLEELVRERLFGADLLEVGYRLRGGRTLGEHLALWDRLAERGLFPVGIGTSDEHGGPGVRWKWSANNFVTWVLAPTPGREDLIAGLRAGRAFFGDAGRFDGRLDVESERGFRMGQVVVTDREEASVVLRADGARTGDDLRAVQAGGVAATWHDPGREARVPYELPRLPGFVRIELTDGAGAVYAVSNPLHFVREVPPGGLPGARAGVDLGGVRCARLGGFHLAQASVERDGPQRVVRLVGRAPAGTLLELEVEGSGVSVVFEGLVGRWTTPEAGHRHRLELSGEGAVLVRSAVE